MTKFARTFTTSLALAACFLLSPAAMAETMTFKADLSASSEVPPAAESNGKGNATITVDTDAKKLSWQIATEGLSGDPTAAHFHGPAKPGENAPPVIDISSNLKEGSADLTDEQWQALQAGNWYVNVHTAKYPDGEIRGQVEKAQ
jgi:hypothetical protein